MSMLKDLEDSKSNGKLKLQISQTGKQCKKKKKCTKQMSLVDVITYLAVKKSWLFEVIHLPL